MILVSIYQQGIIARLWNSVIGRTVLSSIPELTHWGRDKKDAISQTTFSRAFSSMKIVAF